MQVVTPTFITKNREQGVQILPGNIHWHKKDPDDTTSAFLSDPRTGCFHHPFMVWASPFQRIREVPDWHFPATTSNCNTIIIYSVKELKAMDWTRLRYMVHYYISSYIYRIYIYLKTKTKSCKFWVWDLTGIHDSAQNYLLNILVLL